MSFLLNFWMRHGKMKKLSNASALQSGYNLYCLTAVKRFTDSCQTIDRQMSDNRPTTVKR